jgi:hypothetical protein
MTRHLKRPAAACLTLALLAAGCGGSNHTTTTKPAPHSGVAGRCAAQSNGEPGTMGLCLASHGVHLPSNGALTRCAEAANTRADVTACLEKAAR